MKWLPNEDKNAGFFPKRWQHIDKSQNITGKIFAIQTEVRSEITVFDFDFKTDAYPKGAVDGATNLIDAGVDFDDYLDNCIEIKTQSNGYHSIFRYDSRYKTKKQCYGIVGFNIRNDGGCIYAGERYEIVSVGTNLTTLPEEIYEYLVEWEAESKPKTQSIQSDAVHDTPECINSKYFDFVKSLPLSYCTNGATWVNIIYAFKNAVCKGELIEPIAYNTASKLMRS